MSAAELAQLFENRANCYVWEFPPGDPRRGPDDDGPERQGMDRERFVEVVSALLAGCQHPGWRRGDSNDDVRCVACGVLK